MGNVIGTILEKVRDPLENYVSTHASYTLRVGHHVQVLEKEIEILKKKRMDIEDEIQRDERAAKVATDEVQGWLEAVEELEKNTHIITSKYSDRKCMFLGDCSLDCFSNHSIGADAVNVTERVREESGRRDGFTAITKEAPLPAAQLVPVKTLPEASRLEIDLKLGEALNFLRSDSGASLGIWGMGGVGKTFLLCHINNALARDPSFGFDRVVFVTASRDCTVEKIQELVVKELKLKSEPENHRNDIYNYLSKKNFVILLDDLWARLDLLEVGVPPLGMLDGLKRKLILATRNGQVCYDMGARRTIKVNCLSREVARLLFLEEVGEVINSDPQIPTLAEKLADECGGLPKAIICIARAMSGKRRHNLWVKAIEDLKRSNFSMVVQGMEDPLPLLKVSYDYLENPVMQESLLLCALWPEDYKIQKRDVIDCWMAHGLLGEFESMDEADNTGDEIIDKLEKTSLLEYIEDEVGDCWVRLHDLIRDMALWIACDCGGNPKKWIVLDKAPQDEKSWMETRKMSIMNNSKLTTLPSVMCGGSNLTTLILQMKNLSHGDLGILQYLHQLVYLDLSNNRGIRRFPIEVCHLHKLEFLNLSHTWIGELPDELQNLRNLKYLLMQDTNTIVISSQLLSSLVSLQVLNVLYSGTVFYVPNPTMIDNLGCMKRPMKALSIVAHSMSDLNKLTRMSGVMSVWKLHICLRGEKDLTTLCMLPPNSWSRCEELNIDGCESQCTQLVMDGEHIPSPRILVVGNFRCLKEIVWKRVEPRNLNIRFITIDYCPHLKHVTWLKDLPFLERLYLNECENLKQVFLEEATEAENMEEKYKHAFLSLKSLQLHRLPELEAICNHAMTFLSLIHLRVQGCPKLKKLPLDSPTSCTRLSEIECEEEWWKNLELDEGTRDFLQLGACIIWFLRPEPVSREVRYSSVRTVQRAARGEHDSISSTQTGFKRISFQLGSNRTTSS